MKILIVVHDFLPNYYSGTEVLTFELAKEMDKKNDVLLFFSEPLSEKKDKEKGIFKGLKYIKINKDITKNIGIEETYNDKRTEKAFFETLDDFKPDIVHLHHLMHLSINLIDICKKRKIPCIYSLHDFWAICYNHKKLKYDDSLCKKQEINECLKCFFSTEDSLEKIKRNSKDNRLIGFLIKFNITRFFLKSIIERKVKKDLKERYRIFRREFNRLDMIISPSRFLADEYIKSGIRKNVIHVSDDGINDKYFKNFKKNKSKKLRFAFIGTLIPAKGCHVLIEAFNNIKEKDIELQIYGTHGNSKEEKKYYEKLIKDIKNKNIRLCGTFSSDNIADIFKDIDILIVPSIWYENGPLVIKNALLSKTPVIASDLGGMSYLIRHKENGLLFKPNDPKDLYEKLMIILKNQELIRKLEKNIRKPKSIKENAEELIKIFRRIIKENNIDKKRN